MKRIRITKAFFIFLIVFSFLLGAGGAFLFLNPGVIAIAKGDRVTIGNADYEELKHVYTRFGAVNEIWNMLDEQYYTEVDDDALKEGMLKGLVGGLDDKYSAYLTDAEFEERITSITGTFEGVGIVLTSDEEGVYALRTIKGSPAERGGVQALERIVAVNGESAADWDSSKAATKIRGPKGSQVTITFKTVDGETVDRTLTRETIQSESVFPEQLENNIGYIALTSFDDGSTQAMKAALKELESCDGLILDLRDNPGGLVDVALDIADLFMDQATLVYIQDHNGNKEYLNTKAGRIWTKPVVLIINENSASAAEILTAGLKDNGVVTVVGTQSFGKGIIQEMEHLKMDGGLVLTKWQYFSPKGNPIHKIGIAPDIVIHFEKNDFDENGILIHDRQLERAMEIITRP